ncbi:MgtC/SapB family protein [Mucilaginibacter sp.]|jgi:putative Mg2+ transporter-C (MgtC) family protein|uniref:MgtC/SapB family protein n=1 Tax=Mucilaginibacter sp. TaxID=1882438 RepID=UPI002BEE53C2|nr:MgtC/SapB family protein [Mucilaginibacter sp.]HTI61764.1 MgtC/SapB family protein [Mucilaginibacter sp.]
MPLEFGIATHDVIKILIAVLCGGILGFERQYKNKTAGFRTIILICLGSTIFTMISQRAGQGVNINLVTGVGFIGAGVIFKDKISVNGLTTAAVIWVAAAIGMANGAGNYMLAIASTFLTIIVLVLFNLFENYLDKIRHEKLLNLVFDSNNFDELLDLENIIRKHKLTVQRRLVNKKDGVMHAAIFVSGHKKNISKLDEQLLSMRGIRAF